MTKVKVVAKNTVVAKIEVTYWNNETNKMEISNVCAFFDADEYDENMFKVADEIEGMILNLFNEDDGFTDVEWEIADEMYF
jgi:hypothetical protein